MMAGSTGAGDAKNRELLSLFSNDIVLLFDEQFRLLDCNECAPEAYGYARDEFLALTLDDLRAPENPVSVQERMAGVRERRTMVFEGVHRRRDGSRFPGETSIRVVETESGTYYHTTVRDITARQEAEAALRESEERFRYVFGFSPIGKSITSLTGEVKVNRAFCHMLGYSQDELEHTSWRALTLPEDVEETQRQMDLLVSGQSAEARYEKRFLSKDGSIVWADVASSLRRGAAGEPLYFVTAIMDITERKRAEEGLRESEERFEEFAAHLPGYLFMHDDERRYVFVNRRELSDGDVPRESWLGRTPAEVWPGEMGAQEDARVQRALEGEALETTFLWEPAGLHEYLHSIYFRIPRAGKPPLVGGLALDVTEQVQAQEQVLRHADRLRRIVEGVVLAISHVVETRDPYTAGHERRVSELAAAIAEELGFDEKGIERVRTASVLHDVGKISVPAEILSRPGRLSETEFALIKGHPQAAHEILKPIDFEFPLADIVVQHHERLDGSGYPAGLSGEAILPEARILAVADVIESMVSHRPYRAALSLEEALAEIEGGAGRRYDAAACGAAVRLLREQRFTFGE